MAPHRDRLPAPTCRSEAGAAADLYRCAPWADERLQRRDPARFAASCAQARLFRDSLGADEQVQMEAALHGQLRQLEGPAVQQRLLAGLRHVDNAMAMRLAAALRVELPAPLALAGPAGPASAPKPRLAQRLPPGEGLPHSKTVAVLLADGVDARGLPSMEAALLAAGAVVRRLAPRLRWHDAEGHGHEADATYDTTLAAVFDAAVLPLDARSAAVLRQHSQVGELVQRHYRHGKALGVLGGGLDRLSQWGLALRTPAQRAGVVDAAQGPALVAAIAAHRHLERFAEAAVPPAPPASSSTFSSVLSTPDVDRDAG